MEAVSTRRSITPRETWGQAVRRLALQARENGIEVYTYDLGKGIEYYATSHSRPGTLHRVTLISCDCAGFIGHQRCQHHSRLLDVVGELPEPDPIEDAARVALNDQITSARIEVARLRRNPRTTADFHNLEAAKRRLWELVETIPAPATIHPAERLVTAA